MFVYVNPNCLSVVDHFVGLAPKGLKWGLLNESRVFDETSKYKFFWSYFWKKKNIFDKVLLHEDYVTSEIS